MVPEPVVVALATAGLLLPLWGAIRAYRAGLAAIAKARRDASRVAALQTDWIEETRRESERLGSEFSRETVNAQYAELFRAEGLVVPNLDYAGRNASGDLTIVRVLELLVESNVRNLTLILIGTVCGYASTVLPIFFR